MTRLPAAFLKAPLAHRALHDVTDGRPENSLVAIKAAIEKGYGIEIDVQLSSDHVAMVFHDYSLDRLTETDGPVAVHSAVQLGTVRLSGGDEGIPTLTEVLELVAGQVPLLIEIKDQDGAMGPNVGPLERATVEDLQGYQGPVALMSFNPNSVKVLSELAPDIPRGLVTSAYRPEDWPLNETLCNALREIPDFDRTGSSFISHEVADLDRPRVLDLKLSGVPVLCWTVKSPESEAQARQIADNITFEGYLAPNPA